MVCWLVAERLGKKFVYLRDGSPQIILRVATIPREEGKDLENYQGGHGCMKQEKQRKAQMQRDWHS